MACVALLWLAACDDDAGGDDTPPVAPVVACDDYADVVAQVFADCGMGTFEENRVGFEEALGDPCSEADEVRDQGALYGECFDFFMMASCETLGDPDFGDLIIPECRDQILFDGR